MSTRNQRRRRYKRRARKRKKRRLRLTADDIPAEIWVAILAILPERDILACALTTRGGILAACARSICPDTRTYVFRSIANLDHAFCGEQTTRSHSHHVATIMANGELMVAKRLTVRDMMVPGWSQLDAIKNARRSRCRVLLSIACELLAKHDSLAPSIKMKINGSVEQWELRWGHYGEKSELKVTFVLSDKPSLTRTVNAGTKLRDTKIMDAVVHFLSRFGVEMNRVEQKAASPLPAPHPPPGVIPAGIQW